MAEQAIYPQFWRDPRTGTHLRYNSASFVCTASKSQLQVQHLGEHPPLLHSAQAVASTEQAFLDAYDDTCERLLAIGFAVPIGQPLYQRRGEVPDTWYYRQESAQAHLRLNLSQYYGGLSVNLICEDLGAIAHVQLVESPDPRRQPSTAAEFEQALTQAEEALEFAATGGHPRPLQPPPSQGLSEEEAEDFYRYGDPFDGTFSVGGEDDDGS